MEGFFRVNQCYPTERRGPHCVALVFSVTPNHKRLSLASGLRWEIDVHLLSDTSCFQSELGPDNGYKGYTRVEFRQIGFAFDLKPDAHEHQLYSRQQLATLGWSSFV